MMWKYKNWFVSLFLTLLFFVCVQAVRAGTLDFNTTTIEVGVGETFDVDVLVDADPDEINSIDAYITFDDNLIEAQEVVPGTFFPSIAQNLTEGQVYVAGYVDDPATSKSGTGTVATITFAAVSEGTTTLEYFCDTNENESSKIIKNDIDATNVIDCDGNGSVTITVGEGTGDTTPTGTGGTEDSDGDGIPDDEETPDELPQSGTLENVLAVAVPGLALLAIGILFRFL